VLKFGGTSVGTLAKVRYSAIIITQQPLPRAAVVSAASGVTNLLLEAAAHAADGNQGDCAHVVSLIVAKHTTIADGIGDADQRAGAVAILDQLHAALRTNLDQVAAAGELSRELSDRIVATGEKAMSTILAALLRAQGTPAVHVWADSVIATDDRFGNARPNRDKTREQAAVQVLPHLQAGATVIMTGFIGGTEDGRTTTLGRGGSDYSATLLGAAIDADEVQIWTDVPGVLSADPRQIPEARVVPAISYDEAQELAHFGAKVLHPRTIRPAVARGIPVRILSTFAPYERGTVVQRTSADRRIKAVTAMKGLMLLQIDVPELEDLSGAAGTVFQQLHLGRVEVVHAAQASSRRRMTYLVDGASAGWCAVTVRNLDAALEDFEAEVNCNEDVALVAAVGEGAADRPETLGKMMDVLRRAGIPVLGSSQQTSNVALIVVVPAARAQQAVEVVHEAFIGSQAGSARGRTPRRKRMIRESVQVG
ncbi:MAG TPA: aspartate kinase, partial [Thermomicrobiales bacterium]|nr:aspartate kinase [Thermomicrobiales bacterium]